MGGGGKGLTDKEDLKDIMGSALQVSGEEYSRQNYQEIRSSDAMVLGVLTDSYS